MCPSSSGLVFGTSPIEWYVQGISNFKSLEAWKKMKISLILILLGYPEIFRVFSFSGAFLRNHRKRMETIGKLGMPLTGCLGFLKGTSYSIT